MKGNNTEQPREKTVFWKEYRYNAFKIEIDKGLGGHALAIFANLFRLSYYILLGLTHSYAWYMLLLQNLFMLSSPIYILAPVAIMMVCYYAINLYYDPYFWHDNSRKLEEIWNAILKHYTDISNLKHLIALTSLILPSFSIILFLYCVINSFTPSPADMTIYLAHPMLAALAVISAIALIYLTVKPFHNHEKKEVDKKARPSTKTACYIALSMLFYIGCGAALGVILNLFFNPIINYHLCQLSSLASWVIITSFFAAFASCTMLFNIQDECFNKQAADFCNSIFNQRLYNATFSALKGAILGALFAAVVFSIMFSPMIHIVPNIWPYIFGLMSQAAFYRTLLQVSYISAVVGIGASILDSAFTIHNNIPPKEGSQERLQELIRCLNLPKTQRSEPASENNLHA